MGHSRIASWSSIAANTGISPSALTSGLVKVASVFDKVAAVTERGASDFEELASEMKAVASGTEEVASDREEVAWDMEEVASVTEACEKGDESKRKVAKSVTVFSAWFGADRRHELDAAPLRVRPSAAASAPASFCHCFAAGDLRVIIIQSVLVSIPIFLFLYYISVLPRFISWIFFFFILC